MYCFVFLVLLPWRVLVHFFVLQWEVLMYISDLDSRLRLGVFLQIPIITPIVFPMKNCSTHNFVGVLAGFFGHFWIQATVPLLKPLRGGYTFVTGIRVSQPLLYRSATAIDVTDIYML